MKPFELVSRRGARDPRAQRRHDPRGGRRRDPRLPRRRSSASATPAPTSTAPACASPAACAARSSRPARPAIYTQHGRNPERNVQIGGNATVFAPNYGSPFVHDLDNGRRYATHRRLRELREARVLVAVPAPLGRHGVRAGRRAGQQAPPRHGVRPPRTATSRSWARSPPASAPPTRSSWPASRSAATSQDRTVMTSLINASSPLVWDATMLAAAEVYAANNQATIITPFILAGAMAPATVGRRRRADARRVARRHGVHAARAARRAGDLRLVRQLDVDADRRPHVRHARAGDRALHGGRAGPPPRRAVPLGRLAVRLEAARRAGRVRVGGHAAADGAGRRQLRAPRRRLAGGRPGDRLREVRARLRPARHDVDVREGPRHVGERAGARRDPREPARATTSSARPTRWPTSRPRSTASTPPTTRATSSGSTRAASTPPSAPTRCGRSSSPSYEAPPIDDAIDAELREFVERRKAELPDAFA